MISFVLYTQDSEIKKIREYFFLAVYAIMGKYNFLFLLLSSLFTASVFFVDGGRCWAYAQELSVNKIAFYVIFSVRIIRGDVSQIAKFLCGNYFFRLMLFVVSVCRL